MKIISGSSEHLAKQLEQQVYLGSYSWNVVDELMLKAAEMLRKQQKAVDTLMKAADKSAGLRIKAEQELLEYKQCNLGAIMKYRIVEVNPPGVGDVYYEVEEQIAIPDALMKHWKFVAKFNTISACQQYIQNQAQPARKIISEIEV